MATVNKSQNLRSSQEIVGGNFSNSSIKKNLFTTYYIFPHHINLDVLHRVSWILSECINLTAVSTEA